MAAIEVKAACGHTERISYTSGAGAIEATIKRHGLRREGSRIMNPNNCRRCPASRPSVCTCQCDGWCEQCSSMPCHEMHRARALGLA